jgi:kynureninase
MFEPSKECANRLDAQDPLKSFRSQFFMPRRANGETLTYLCGHSLGLQPVQARRLVDEELDQWANLGVDGHFRGEAPWYSYHEMLREPGARLVGALPHEVVFMNSLTVNLHLLMATFFRPNGRRRCILIDEPAFPSDLYAVQSQLRHHELNPEECLLAVEPEAKSYLVRLEEAESILEARGDEISLVLWSGVNFLSGEFFDLKRLTAAAHRHGCLVGIDLAHAIGNVPLRLHDWGIDFAVWCSYKYLNAGPGAVGGCFVHERHSRNTSLPRLAGWWGNDPATRFKMQLEPRFVPVAGADGWQVSNPPILAMAPLRASLALFDEAGMFQLRAKSERLTAYCLYLLDRLPGGRFELVTPREAARRGSQISLVIHDRPEETFTALEAAGVVCDFRKPNVIRAAAVPFYNTFHDVWHFVDVLSRL